MKLTSNIPQTLWIKINKSIMLLDKEYRELDFKINFYPERGKLEYERENKPDLLEKYYEDILFGDTIIGGLTCENKKEIKIFLFQYEKLEVDVDPREVTLLIGKVFHEIRHAWQIKKNLYQNEPTITNLDENIKTYLNLPSEKDAYLFEKEQMTKHLSDILRIFDVELPSGKAMRYEMDKEILRIITS